MKHADIINLFADPTVRKRNDPRRGHAILAPLIGIPKPRVRGWETASSIPIKYWRDIIAAGARVSPPVKLNILDFAPDD